MSFAQGDKLLLENRSNAHATSLRIKSTVANRVRSLYDHGFAWSEFQKRKELMSWKLYNLRDQVQKLVSLRKVTPGVPYINIADSLIAELSRIRYAGYVAAHSGDSVFEDTTMIDDDDDAGEAQGSGNESDDSGEFLCTPIH